MPPETPQWRPQVHFSARRHWINDPNGLVWHEGEYHLFFQHNPQGNEWGHMSWGHAVSTDLLHWQELPLALAEDDAWMIFSGSVVIDHANTSGFGREGIAPMVAVYTGAARQPGGVQNQQLAFSLDRGRTWTKYAGNPVLDLGVPDFRDPQVFWHAPTARWVMLVSMAAAGYLCFFASDNLREWRPLSECHLPVPAGCRVWECPNLLRLPVHGADGHRTEREAWLLKFDVFEGHPGGGSGALAVVGEFDGTRFTPQRPAPESLHWVDGGKDFYAAIAFGAMPPGDGRCVWMGWMNDHHYARFTPTHPWRGAMTLPRELYLTGPEGRMRLAQRPLRELVALREPALQAAALEFGQAPVNLAAPGHLPLAHDIEIDVALAGGHFIAPNSERTNAHGGALGFVIELRANDSMYTCIGVDRQRGELFIDRTCSGVAVCQGGFAGRRASAWPAAGGADGRVRLRIVVDACSVEVFSDDGLAVISELIFPAPGATGVRLATLGGTARLLSFRAWPLRTARA